VIGRNGNCEAAYPPELLSIEAYTRGELKAGDVLSAENVDIVKDIAGPPRKLQPPRERQHEQDGEDDSPDSDSDARAVSR
jgi:hypothetical protein